MSDAKDFNNNDVFTKTWEVVTEEIDDGSGDIWLPIPDEVLEALGWGEDTELDVNVYPDTQKIIITEAKND